MRWKLEQERFVLFRQCPINIIVRVQANRYFLALNLLDIKNIICIHFRVNCEKKKKLYNPLEDRDPEGKNQCYPLYPVKNRDTFMYLTTCIKISTFLDLLSNLISLYQKIFSINHFASTNNILLFLPSTGILREWKWSTLVSSSFPWNNLHHTPIKE